MRARLSSSGRFLSLVEQAQLVSELGYTAAAPLVLELQPAGHAPGQYLVNLSLVVLAVATTGNLSRSYQFSAPRFGPAEIAGFGVATITAVGAPNGAPNASFTGIGVISDGLLPLTVTLTPGSITGSPVVDVYASAALLAEA